MDFRRSADHDAFLTEIGSFVDRAVRPEAERIDRSDSFPADLVSELGDRGYLGMPFAESVGGLGLDYHQYADGVVELSRGSGGIGTIVAAHTSLPAAMIDAYGTHTHRDRFLRPLCTGTELGAFALSEPQAGSDVGAIETTAQNTDSGYRLSGEKQWVSNGSEADTIVVFANTDAGISSFVTRPASDPGISVVRTESKLGDHGSPTAVIEFDDVLLSTDRRLGEPGAGFKQALETLNGGRISIAARSIGIAKASVEGVESYLASSPDRVDTQSVRHRLADMHTAIRGAELLMHEAADRRMRGQSYVTAAAMAKLRASEMSREVSGTAIDIVGPTGLTATSGLGRLYRDAKLNEIYEGTSEILRNTIADRV